MRGPLNKLRKEVGHPKSKQTLKQIKTDFDPTLEIENRKKKQKLKINKIRSEKILKQNQNRLSLPLTKKS